MYRTVEDDDRNIEDMTTEDDSEIQMPSTAAMNNAAMWVHAKENILKNCRTAHQDVEDDGSNPDFDPEEAKKALESGDPYEARLKSIANDSEINISEFKKMCAW